MICDGNVDKGNATSIKPDAEETIFSEKLCQQVSAKIKSVD